MSVAVQTLPDPEDSAPKILSSENGSRISKMNRHRAALQSFSIDSLIGNGKDNHVGERKRTSTAADESCPLSAEMSSPEECHGHRTDMTVAPPYGRTSGSPVHQDASAVQHQKLSTLFNIMVDTAVQQQPRPALQSPLPPPQPPSYDYYKILQLQSAATAAAAAAVGKMFSPRSLWPYLNDAATFPRAPALPLACYDPSRQSPPYSQPSPQYGQPSPPPSFECPDDADSDDDAVPHFPLPNVSKPVGDTHNVGDDDDDMSANQRFGEYYM